MLSPNFTIEVIYVIYVSVDSIARYTWLSMFIKHTKGRKLSEILETPHSEGQEAQKIDGLSFYLPNFDENMFQYKSCK